MGPGVCPPCPQGWALALQLQAVSLTVVSFLLSWGKTELCGSLGVDQPVSRLWVWEPLCFFSWQPAWGGYPITGECPRIEEKEHSYALGTTAAL